MTSSEKMPSGDDFDTEFEMLLGEINQDEDNRIELEKDMRVWADLLDRVSLYGVEHQLVTNSAEMTARSFQEYTDTYKQQAIYNLQFSPEGIKKSDHRRIASEMIIAYHEEFEFQDLVVRCAASVTGLYKYDPSRSAAKKALHADFLIHYGRKANDPMLAFFANEVPGDNLDVTDPDDKVFLDIAHAKLDQFKRDQSKKYQVLEMAKGLLGLDDESSDEIEISRVTYVLLNMLACLQRPIVGERAADRSALLTKMARDLGRSNNMTNAVVALIEAHYPIWP